ncbi:nuclear transport factor 2 family protein [Candidatus Poribacteria bacterium]|nr:nuclear transport factor 2 family protein [Candidatus Poribacteria bacterium]
MVSIHSTGRIRPRSLGVILSLFFLHSLADANPSDFFGVYQLHNAWKSAFEQADIDGVSRIWAHTDDVKLINLFDDTRLGWDDIHAELFLLFQRVGPTQVTTANLLICVIDDRASATSDYRWSPIPKIPLVATERYQKRDRKWKMVGHDATGGTLPPLRPAVEPHIRNHLSVIDEALLTKNADVLAKIIADGFRFTEKNGTPHDQFDPDLINGDLAEIDHSQLEVVFLNDEVAWVYYLVQMNNPKLRRIRLDLIPPQWQIQHINFQNDENPLPVFSRMNMATTWAAIKMAQKAGVR